MRLFQASVESQSFGLFMVLMEASVVPGFLPSSIQIVSEGRARKLWYVSSSKDRNQNKEQSGTKVTFSVSRFSSEIVSAAIERFFTHRGKRAIVKRLHTSKVS